MRAGRRLDHIDPSGCSRIFVYFEQVFAYVDLYKHWSNIPPKVNKKLISICPRILFWVFLLTSSRVFWIWVWSATLTIKILEPLKLNWSVCISRHVAWIKRYVFFPWILKHLHLCIYYLLFIFLDLLKHIICACLKTNLDLTKLKCSFVIQIGKK